MTFPNPRTTLKKPSIMHHLSKTHKDPNLGKNGKDQHINKDKKDKGKTFTIRQFSNLDSRGWIFDLYSSHLHIFLSFSFLSFPSFYLNYG